MHDLGALEDEEEELDECDGKFEDTSEDHLEVKGSGFEKLSAVERHERLTLSFAPELIASLQAAWKVRFDELSKMNLPYWNVEIHK